MVEAKATARMGDWNGQFLPAVPSAKRRRTRLYSKAIPSQTLAILRARMEQTCAARWFQEQEWDKTLLQSDSVSKNGTYKTLQRNVEGLLSRLSRESGVNVV